MPTVLCFLLLLMGNFSFLPGATQAGTVPKVALKNLALTERLSFEISLVTFSPGDNLFEWFGHTVLAVENLRTGKSVAYSFGGFSFGTDDLLMFFMGKFIFWTYTEDTRQLLHRYQKKGRHIVIQKLNLSAQQTTNIRKRLQLSMQPQNRFYTYDHFRDNCATRLRDIVNEALGDTIRAQSATDTGKTIRDYIQRMTAHQPILNFLLHFVLSDGVDQPVSHWETMFLPDRLMTVFQNSINPEMGRPLVSAREEQLPHYKSPFFSEKINIPQTSGREWLAGLSLGPMFAILALMYLKKITRLSASAYPLVIAFFGAVFGLLGVVLFFMAVIADHTDVFWNENFFLLNPLTFTLLPLGLLKIFGKAGRLFAVVSLLCGTLGVVGVVLKVLPAFDQGNGQQIRILLPMLIIMGITGFFELKKQSPKVSD
ncbi:MAG: DUF4105 domain-containing protein [Deltaproteobacteria bacterium]|nr:DUF4105 domain-containing protein [Deltaproteobacteria bacterium]